MGRSARAAAAVALVASLCAASPAAAAAAAAVADPDTSTLTPTPTPTADPDGWVSCANEWERCVFTGTQEVRYGADGIYTAPRTFTDGVDCNNFVFDDPVVGVLKHCDRRSPGEPAPIAGQGYTKTWSDEFDTLDARLDGIEDDSRRWNVIWYRPAPPSGAVTVSNGVLSMNSRRSDGYPDLDIATRRATQTGSTAFTYGYFEARMRWTGGQGHWPAFWLINLQHSFEGSLACPVLNNELDVMEGQGAEPNVVYTTLHRNTSGRCGVADQLAPAGSHWYFHFTNLPGTWHTYAALWTSDQGSKWYIDGQLINQTPVFDSTDQPMFVILSSNTGGWTGDPDATSADDLVTEVDWVRVWQR